MEHIVESGARQKLQTYGHLIDDLRHPIGSNETGLQLPGDGAWQ
jgi:hypothetical protein